MNINNEIKLFRITSEEDKKNVLKDIQTFMGEYADPYDEIYEVVEKNKETATIFEVANPDGERTGIAFLIPIPYEKFQPKYHLAYIAVDPRKRGRNIGRLLFNKVIDYTQGDFSLHVSPKNVDALCFYEKMGMKKKYIRMTLK